MLGSIVRLFHLLSHFQILTKSCLISFRILITGNNSGLVETITDAVSIHSIKKAEYARRLAEGRLGHVTLYDHFKTVRTSSINIQHFPYYHYPNRRFTCRPTATPHQPNSPAPNATLPNRSQATPSSPTSSKSKTDTTETY